MDQTRYGVSSKDPIDATNNNEENDDFDYAHHSFSYSRGKRTALLLKHGRGQVAAGTARTLRKSSSYSHLENPSTLESCSAPPKSHLTPTTPSPSTSFQKSYASKSTTSRGLNLALGQRESKDGRFIMNFPNGEKSVIFKQGAPLKDILEKTCLERGFRLAGCHVKDNTGVIVNWTLATMDQVYGRTINITEREEDKEASAQGNLTNPQNDNSTIDRLSLTVFTIYFSDGSKRTIPYIPDGPLYPHFARVCKKQGLELEEICVLDEEGTATEISSDTLMEQIPGKAIKVFKISELPSQSSTFFPLKRFKNIATQITRVTKEEPKDPPQPQPLCLQDPKSSTPDPTDSLSKPLMKKTKSTPNLKPTINLLNLSSAIKPAQIILRWKTTEDSGTPPGSVKPEEMVPETRFELEELEDIWSTEEEWLFLKMREKVLRKLCAERDILYQNRKQALYDLAEKLTLEIEFFLK